MNRFVCMMAVFGLVAAATTPETARATTLAPLSHDQMVDASDLIVEGTVISTEAFADDAGRVWTRATVKVERSLKGAVGTGSTVIVEAAGGMLDDGRMTAVHLAPRYNADERVLLYLVSRRFGAAYGTVGMMMGKFTIKQNPADGSDMVVRFTVAYPHTYDARFIPNPASEARVSLVSMEAAVRDRVSEGWDGQPIAGVPAAHLREINKLQPGVK